MPHAATSACPRVLQLTIAAAHQLKLGWLDDLPNANSLCAHICLKGIRCDSASAKAALGKLSMRLHSCVEEPGGHENGHEGVCAYRFLLDNYDAPWDNVYFLHGDAPTSHHGYQFRSFRNFLQANEWPKWPKRRSLMKPEHCGCGHYGSDLNPFGPRDFWHLGLTWWFGQMIVPRDASVAASYERWATSADCRHAGPAANNKTKRCARYGVGAWPLHNGTLSSPLGFMFHVDRASALQRSRRFLEAQYRICKVGVRVLPPGASGGAPRAARLSAPGFDYNPLVWGHVNERIPFFVFGHEFVERDVPACLFEGFHADMNCSQPEAEGVPHHSLHLHRLAHADASALPAPSVAWGCKPFDRSCGTTG